MKPTRAVLALLGLTSSALLVPTAFAQSVWDGGGADNKWQTPQNWSTDVAPTASTTTDLQFAGSLQTSASNDYATGADFRNITFAAGASSFTLDGNQFDLFGAVTNSSGTTQTIGTPINLQGASNNIVGSAGAKTIFNGAINYGTGRLFPTTTAHTLVFNAAGTNGGASVTAFAITGPSTMRVNIAGSIIELGNAAALGTGYIQVNANSTLQSNTALTGANAVGNTFMIGAAAILTIGGTSNLELSGSSTTLTSPASTSGGALINAGANRTLAVTNTGTTTVSGKVSLSDAVGTGRTLTVDVASTAGATTISGAIVNYVNPSTGAAGGLTKTGTGTLTLTGANTYTGATTVSAGTLSLSTPYIADTSTLTVATGATLNLTHSATDRVTTLFLGGVKQAIGIYGAIGSGAQFETAFITGTGRIEVANPTWDGGGANGNWSTAANWNGDVAPATTGDTLSFAGTTNLATNNDYITSLGGSATKHAITFNSGAGSFTLAGGDLAITSNYIADNQSANPQTIGNNLTLAGGDNRITLATGAGALTFNGSLALSGARLYLETTNSGTIVLNGASTGGGVTFNSWGITEFRSVLYASNTFPATIVELGNKNALGAPNSSLGGLQSGVQVASELTIRSNTDLSGANAVDKALLVQSAKVLTLSGSNNLQFTGNVYNAGGNGTILVNNTAATTLSGPTYLSNDTTGRLLNVNVAGTAGTTTLSGVIADSWAAGAAAGSLVKLGTGTLVVSGNNTYTGTTTVSAGTLTLTQPYLNDASTVNIASGATLNLTHASTDTVATLVINGVTQGNGVYGAIGSGAAHEVAQITGTGKLQVGAGYSAWSTANAGGQAANLDYDNDGVTNGVEYFLNAAAGVTANPGVVSGKVTWTNGGNIPSGSYGTAFVVQTSPDLTTWTDILANDSNLSNAAGSVQYTLPTGAGKLFVRLKVTPN
ncbi:autotransporter-associated beta strand repeat-containing protein [Luteolibacter sp. LG18]|uniref:beta strand repeat-containing protein n=1 Tax=Luteolibacter sp. LG18 TaxID=2819286 RepID=UPI002B29B0E9|nr:hypothetical protein llg_44120 [Luteolibacter sp. LG18]